MIKLIEMAGGGHPLSLQKISSKTQKKINAKLSKLSYNCPLKRKNCKKNPLKPRQT